MSQESNPVDPRVPLARHRTDLASFRTQLAMDRTMLAWSRTTLSIAGFGFGMVGFFRTMEQKSPGPESARLHAAAIRFGVALILLGIGASMASGISHWFTLRKIRRGETPVVTQWPLSITLGMLLAILGAVGLWALFE